MKTGSSRPAPEPSPAGTARQLAAASITENTRRAYVSALRRLEGWMAGPCRSSSDRSDPERVSWLFSDFCSK